ncbi:EAL domain-containing protein [Billgrantia pellis]|uniref:cyclic-guanylate-specific phosphodiesterase n=2 Tax=Billgrantia pellis TaxID=2606936 RepID=A0A7V7FWT3_9GAMM|nr:EAL domain-containing protein [Halomonas pellis]
MHQRDQFFTLSLELFCRVDLDGRFLQVNPTFERLLGYPVDRLVGSHYGDLIKPDDHAAFENAIAQLQHGQVIRGLEIQARDSEGREHWLEVNAALGEEHVIYVVARNVTERKRNEEALRHNQHLFRIVGETALIGGWYVDLTDGRAVWSSEVNSIHDEPADFQPTLAQAIDYYPAHCRDRLKQRLDACIHHGVPFDEEFEVVTGRGRKIVVRVLGQAVKDDSGRVVRIHGSTQDITEQKRLHEEVSRLTSRLARTLETMTVAFVTLDKHWRFSYLNAEAEHLLESSRDELLGCNIWEVFPEAQGTRFEVEYRRALAQNEPVTFEERFARLQAWFEVSAYPSEEGLAIYFQNISMRKRVENQLRLLERSVDSSVNGVVIVDATQPDLPIVYVNPAFERITGYRRDEVLGFNCRLLQGEETTQSTREALRHGIAAHSDVHVVIRNYRRDGTPFWNDLYISPVRDESGAVTHFVGVQNDITTQRESQAQLAHSATHDALTELPNRIQIENAIRQGCQVSAQAQRYLAVLILDLDDFKPINNTLGHDTGDQVLIEVARRLERQLRPGDSAGRFGGDEFVVTLPGLTGTQECVTIIESLLAEIALPYHIEVNELYLTGSIGVSIFNGDLDSEIEPQTLLQQADLAMYQAKRLGRNTYQFFTPDLNEKVRHHLALRNELQRAIEEGQFELHYQPQVHGPSARIIGFEALLRWKHPERGYVSPADFIGVAENTGQIVPISDWVLATACRDSLRLNELGLGQYVMSVNVSPLQFQRNCFLPDLLEVLTNTGLDPSLLELELTENILMGNTETVIETLREIRSHGIGIAIDDFGTGFSSLSYLKYLPITKIKIDRSFIQEVISDHRDAAITHGITSIANQLQLQVVAEGVETQAQYAYLQKHLCESFQGYLFARPMPLKELADFLGEHHQAQALDRERREGGRGGQTLLLLDDEANILRALKRLLRRDGYHVLTTTSAQEAFELLATHDVQVIISDQRMPEMSGTEFLRRAKDLYPGMIQIVLSGYTDLKTVTEAINESAIYKFLTKPWDDDELRLVVQQAFRQFAKQQVQRRNQDA